MNPAFLGHLAGHVFTSLCFALTKSSISLMRRTPYFGVLWHSARGASWHILDVRSVWQPSAADTSGTMVALGAYKLLDIHSFVVSENNQYTQF